MSEITATIPLPIQIVIDDVGWWSGEDGSARQEPYRTGFVRDHVPADYEAVASLGRQLNMRPQAAFILCEWDKNNILRNLPSSTWMGEYWDNSRRVGPWLEEAAEIIRASDKYFEFTLHGIGHEYWQESAAGERHFTRAEWCDAEGNMRPREQVLAHLDYYARLMEQHNFGTFPTSFVPCAFLHRFDDSPGGMAAILKECGVNFISTPFHRMHGTDKVASELFGFEAGVMTVDRGPDVQNWRNFGLPENAAVEGSICGLHWPNILHPDPQRNEEIVRDWVAFLKTYDLRDDRMLAADTQQFATQLAHHALTTCKIDGNTATLDFSHFNAMPQSSFRRGLTLKIRAPQALTFTCADAEVVLVEERQIGQEVLHTLDLTPPQQAVTVHVHWSAGH